MRWRAVPFNSVFVSAARHKNSLSLGFCDTHINVTSQMPEISRFLGIVIAMFYRDHAPAHFHAVYSDYEITVAIETGVVTGSFPRRALRHVLEWYELHKDDLLEDWELAQARRPLKKIAPLE